MGLFFIPDILNARQIWSHCLRRLNKIQQLYSIIFSHSISTAARVLGDTTSICLERTLRPCGSILYYFSHCVYNQTLLVTQTKIVMFWLSFRNSLREIKRCFTALTLFNSWSVIIKYLCRYVGRSLMYKSMQNNRKLEKFQDFVFRAYKSVDSIVKLCYIILYFL